MASIKEIIKMNEDRKGGDMALDENACPINGSKILSASSSHLNVMIKRGDNDLIKIVNFCGLFDEVKDIYLSKEELAYLN